MSITTFTILTKSHFLVTHPRVDSFLFRECTISSKGIELSCVVTEDMSIQDVIRSGHLSCIIVKTLTHDGDIIETFELKNPKLLSYEVIFNYTDDGDTILHLLYGETQI